MNAIRASEILVATYKTQGVTIHMTRVQQMFLRYGVITLELLNYKLKGDV